MWESKLEALTIGDLMRKLLNNIALLVDKEVELARQEAKENVSQMVGGIGLLVGGAVLLLTAFICLVVAAILALSAIMPGWLAAVLVAIFLIIVGALLAIVGRSRLVSKPMGITVATFKEDLKWVRRQMTSSAK